jgi:hypothetical protein
MRRKDEACCLSESAKPSSELDGFFCIEQAFMLMGHEHLHLLALSTLPRLPAYVRT